MSAFANHSSERGGKKRKRASRSKPDPPSDEDTDDTGTQVFQSQLSHKAAQLELAGVSDTNNDPTLAIRDFPHRGAGHHSSQVEGKTENDEDDRHLKPRPRENDRKGHLDVLLRSIDQFLDQGQISKAARAYGLVLQLRPRSLPIDVRSYNLWAIGAEILMRQGEEQRGQHQAASAQGTEAFSDYDSQRESSKAQRRASQRWGSGANMSKVKAYFETLARQYPYDPKAPDKICSVDFWLALLSCEVYNAHADFVIGLGLLDEQVEERNDDFLPEYDPEELDSFGHRELNLEDAGHLNSYELSQQLILAKRKDNVRKIALNSIKDTIAKMEKLMEEAPYSKHGHFLRLRATSSLFAADLCIPMVHVSPTELREAETRRALEQRVAVNAIREISNTKDDMSTITDALFDAYLLREQDADGPPSYLRASLTIREVL